MRLTSLTENDWTQIWAVSSIPIEEDRRFTRIVCPLLLSSPVVLCLFSSPDIVTDSWRFCGYASIETASGLTVGNNPDCRLGNAQKVWANRFKLLHFPLIVSNYSFVFDASIVGDVQFFLWEYTGAIEQ